MTEEVCFYKYEVYYYDCLDDKIRYSVGEVIGSSFEEACARVVKYFGEPAIESVSIEWIEGTECGVYVVEDFVHEEGER